MTRDIDLDVSLSENDIDVLVRLFAADYYLDRREMSRAIAQRSLFNLIHNESVIKVDMIVLKANAYRLEEFARRQRITVGDFQTWIVSREDLILSKLYWARDSRSELQLRDARNLFSSECDFDYLRRQAVRLGVDDLFSALEVSSEPDEK